MITLGPEHYREAKSLLLATAALSSVVAIGLVGGGIYLAMLPPSSTTGCGDFRQQINFG